MPVEATTALWGVLAGLLLFGLGSGAVAVWQGRKVFAFTRDGDEAGQRLEHASLLSRGQGRCVVPCEHDAPERLRAGVQLDQVLDVLVHRLLFGREDRERPAVRLGQPDDVVGAVLFLLSEQARFITGTLGAGRIRTGDELALPDGRHVRVRGLHALGRPETTVEAVARVGTTPGVIDLAHGLGSDDTHLHPYFPDFAPWIDIFQRGETINVASWRVISTVPDDSSAA